MALVGIAKNMQKTFRYQLARVRLFIFTLSFAGLILFFLLVTTGTQAADQGHKSGDKVTNTSSDESTNKPSLHSSSQINVPAQSSQSATDSLSQGEGSGRLSILPSVFVRKIKVEGNTVLTNEELSIITAPYENRAVSFEELQALRREITTHYVNKGYINSGALIPDQPVVDGLITLMVIEGRLTEIGIEGDKYFDEEYLRDRLTAAAGPPLNISKIQQALLQLQEDPRINLIKAELKPGLGLGEGILQVRVRENKPYQIGLEVNNHQSPSVGSIRSELHLAHQNLTGYGDSLEGDFGFTEGLHDLDLSYAFPFNARDTSLKLQFRRSDSSIIEEFLKPLDIKSKSESYGLTFSQPYYTSAASKFTLSLTGEHRRSKVWYDHDQPLLYAWGVEDGETIVSVIRFSKEWLNRNQYRVLALYSCLSLGIDAFGATMEDEDVNAKFLAWLGQVQWVRRLQFFDSQLVFRTDIQLARDPLLPLEKFAVGGMESVRGYRENQLVGDNGLVSSLEWRVPIFRYGHGTGLVELATFFDFGRTGHNEIKGTGNGVEQPSPQSIFSVGLGLRWAMIERIHFHLYAGQALKKVDDDQTDNLQDKGIHFRLSGRVF